ncbi:MAG TPA: CHAT domain-containing protein, partial [Thermoanaerobaculia bacterium]|nr:CHAT domain-containing protein [Thermoanaerobaculia bacterium]
MIQGELLDDDTLLLEYLLGEKKSYLWAVSPTSLTTFELPPRSVIEPLVQEFRESLAHSYQPALRARAELAGNRLTAILLTPVAEELARKGRVALVLDRSLQSIPFAVLPDPADLRIPLLMRHEIVVVPSASALAALRKRSASRPPPPKTLAILADPVFSAADPRISSSSSSVTPLLTSPDRSRSLGGDPSVLPRLPFSRQEAQNIRARVPKGQALTALGFEATRELALSPELGRYRIIHFASHGIINESDPRLSGIVLSRFDETGRPQESFLEVRTIRKLALSADLVVLSACQTALGREVAGEGLVGLSNGFLAAGSLRVLASLWSVSDVATAELMERFYRGLFEERLTPAMALRQAQLSLMK